MFSHSSLHNNFDILGLIFKSGGSSYIRIPERDGQKNSSQLVFADNRANGIFTPSAVEPLSGFRRSTMFFSNVCLLRPITAQIPCRVPMLSFDLCTFHGVVAHCILHTSTCLSRSFNKPYLYKRDSLPTHV